MEQGHPPLALVVDDDGRALELMELVLGIEGFRVATATGGAEALERIDAEVPDLVLVDCLMPGMDGLELCRRIRALPSMRSVPLVMLSGLDDEATRRDAGAAGADEFVLKPVDREVLRRCVDRLRARPVGIASIAPR
jgi:two-component system alkaline phosphatase synthesis response regulator PhoP